MDAGNLIYWLHANRIQKILMVEYSVYKPILEIPRVENTSWEIGWRENKWVAKNLGEKSEPIAGGKYIYEKWPRGHNAVMEITAV